MVESPAQLNAVDMHIEVQAAADGMGSVRAQGVMQHLVGSRDSRFGSDKERGRAMWQARCRACFRRCDAVRLSCECDLVEGKRQTSRGASRGTVVLEGARNSEANGARRKEDI